MYCTFISKDDLFEIFVLVRSVALGPCKSLLCVQRTNELAVAAAMKGPAKRGATPKDRPQRDAIATANQEHVKLRSSCFIFLFHVLIHNGLYLRGNLRWTSRSRPSSYATGLPVLCEKLCYSNMACLQILLAQKSADRWCFVTLSQW